MSSSVDRPTLYPGDYIENTQVVDLTGQDLVVMAAEMTGIVVPTGIEMPGYTTGTDSLLHYRMDEVSGGARDEVDWKHDLRMADGIVSPSVPTYNLGYGLARTWGAGAGDMVGASTPDVIPAAGLPSYTVDWWQNFDVDSISTSNGVSPVVFQLRSVTAGGLRIRWLGNGGGGAHLWRLQIEHWNASVYFAQSFVATARVNNQGDEFFSVAFDDTTMAARVYINGVFIAATGAFAVIPGQPIPGARIQIGDPLYYGTIDDLRLSNTNHDLAAHQAAYATRLNSPSVYSVSWWLHINVDGEHYASCKITADASGRPAYMQAPSFHLPGVHTISARLELGLGA
ncbi:MAG: hypothetical protein PHX83_06820 [Acidobacteriia bacterium]|nr:hypothetical protein [Terriglobia bacterium]